MTFNLQLGDTGSGGANEHNHRYGVDMHGDGNTGIDDNHAHIIVNGEVMSAGDDNHSHPDIDFPFKGTQSVL